VFLALSHNQAINIGSKSAIATGNRSICACSCLLGSYKVGGFVNGAGETPIEPKLVESSRFRAKAL
jgi:hypothetical protein